MGKVWITLLCLGMFACQGEETSNTSTTSSDGGKGNLDQGSDHSSGESTNNSKDPSTRGTDNEGLEGFLRGVMEYAFNVDNGSGFLLVNAPANSVNGGSDITLIQIDEQSFESGLVNGDVFIINFSGYEAKQANSDGSFSFETNHIGPVILLARHLEGEEEQVGVSLIYKEGAGFSGLAFDWNDEIDDAIHSRWQINP